MSEKEADGALFTPKFGNDGLLTAVIVDVQDGAVLMVGHMNAEALTKTRASGRVHFYSRSRQCLWVKGETSGNYLDVEQILVDCDQDCLMIRAKAHGPTCHTGVRSCFYRQLSGDYLHSLKG